MDLAEVSHLGLAEVSHLDLALEIEVRENAYKVYHCVFKKRSHENGEDTSTAWQKAHWFVKYFSKHTVSPSTQCVFKLGG